MIHIDLLTEFFRHSLAVLIFKQFTLKLLFEILRLFLMDRQERYRFDINKSCSHFHKLAGYVHIRNFHSADIIKILLNKLQDRYIVYVDFMFADKVKEQIHRSLEHL